MNTRYYFRRLSEIGFLEASLQAKELLAIRASKTWGRFRDRYIRRPINESQLVRLCGFTSIETAASHFKSRTEPRFSLPEPLEIRRFSSIFPAEAERILEAAGHVLQHRFDLLGSGPIKLDAFRKQRVSIVDAAGTTREEFSTTYLPWQLDFKAGIGWSSQTYSKDVRYGHIPGLDVKIPWELSRFQHAIVLGQAFSITREERYAHEFVCQVIDWIEQNPPSHGVNWSCTMEVGIRAVNWIWGFYLLRESSSLDPKFCIQFLASLYNHAQFIRGNLEYREAWTTEGRRRLNSNHYLSDIVGLLYIGVLFPEFRLKEYADFAAKELEIELFKQTYEDGTDYEHSTFYHRLVFELFLSAFLLLKINGHQLSPEVKTRLGRMADFAASYTRPDGTAPQIGDVDNGRLHPLSVRPIADHTYLPSVAAIVRDGAASHESNTRDGDPEVWWWTGSVVRAERHGESTAYPHGGFYVLRNSDTHVMIVAAQVGMLGLGSHSHNDALSFEYWARGNAWLVDPGTYLYTSDAEARNFFRSTRAHNTVRIDDEEINPFRAEHLFQMSGNASIRVHEWKCGEALDILDAEHAGYERLPEGVTHRRKFVFDKRTGALSIEDSFRGTGQHVFEWNFHVDPDIELIQAGSAVVLKSGSETVTLSTPTDNIQLVECWHSPSYGIRREVKCIVIKLMRTVPFSVSFSVQSERKVL